MKHIYFLSIALFFSVKLFSQVIIPNPLLPTDKQQTVITFYADRGNKGLMGYTGDIYAHTGVITNKSTSNSDWKYVKAGWTSNTAACKLTRINTNEFQLTLSPSIREFYGVPTGEKILKLAFVFRNSDGLKTGREANGGDIFANAYEEGVNVSFTKPQELFVLANDAQNITIEINATGHDSIQFFLDNQYLKSTTAATLTDTITATGTQKHVLVAKAFKNPNIATDTAYFIVKGTTETALLPPGYRDGIAYPDSQSVTFVLNAPYKKNVYLIGDFNQWVPDNSWLMKKDGDRFWLTVTGLTKGKEYIFQYLIDDTLRVTDPYCDKTSDPWSDKYISGSIYPNLMAYPSDKTSEVAGYIQPGQSDYTWENNTFSPPDKNKLVIYEMLIRDFSVNKTIKSATDTLWYLKKLGVTAIELMPFSEFEGNDSWGYNPSFYFAPDKAYGTKNDYKAFIDECHKQGIAVIMDLVLNHSYGQSPLARMYLDKGKPASNNPWYNREHNMQNPDAQWGYDFNHQSIYTQKLVDSITSYWMSEYKIDGFRFDFTKGFTNTTYGTSSWASEYDAPRVAILKRMATEIWKRKASAYVIFEHLAVNEEETELANFGIMLWGNMNSAYNEATMGYHESSKSDFSWISYLKRGWNQPNVVGYMESHDEERLMVKNIAYGNTSGSYTVKDLNTALNRQEMAACFFIPIPGPKMIWQFGEVGYDISINYGGRLTAKPTHWEYYGNAERHRIFRVYSALNSLKNYYALFSTSSYTMDVTGSVKSVKLTFGNQHAVIVGNFDVTTQQRIVIFPATGKWYDYFTGDSITLDNTNKTITLQPGEYHLYSNIKLLGFPFSPLSVKQIQTQETKVFPNPCNNYLIVQTDKTPEKAIMQTLDGRKVFAQNILANNIDMSNYPKGIYFLTLYFKNSKKVIKVIKE